MVIAAIFIGFGFIFSGIKMQLLHRNSDFSSCTLKFASLSRCNIISLIWYKCYCRDLGNITTSSMYIKLILYKNSLKTWSICHFSLILGSGYLSSIVFSFNFRWSTTIWYFLLQLTSISFQIIQTSVLYVDMKGLIVLLYNKFLIWFWIFCINFCN